VGTVSIFPSAKKGVVDDDPFLGKKEGNLLYYRRGARGEERIDMLGGNNTGHRPSCPRP
jgi:hypothetical protein